MRFSHKGFLKKTLIPSLDDIDLINCIIDDRYTSITRKLPTGNTDSLT